ncbi:hydrolase [Haliangium ochraceum]|uniref:Isochorismatase hydrolase n=1 Tax=Haliangium ochraceum (strain DSM 14365 / JCM 11303 / SMP-2) TaxID=502025 RepID=D0LSA3_HALO1|nr:hydrolase [Haliangium ochraceum]ACY15602.1 isochorismatase hydrolase [Haliangium ochraceum DSM 14365]
MTQSKLDLITPDNATLAFIDYQPQMFFGVQSHDRQMVTSNVLGLAKAAKTFGVPTILTTVETQSFSGNMMPQLLDVFPEQPLVERTSMNSWDDKEFVQSVKKSGRKKLILSALWTEVCLTFPALEAMRDGYEVYFVTDTSGGTSKEAHDMAVQRMTQAGAVPLTWMQLALEWQRDWARKEHYDEVLAIMKEHGGAYGQGIEYAYTMVHGAPASRAG